jgi:hypothetical protein
MSLPHLLEWLDGEAAFIKGGRNYVHGTSILPATDRIAQRLGSGHVEKIEFHLPLRNIGVFCAGHLPPDIDSSIAVASGSLAKGPDCSIPFLIFPSPRPIVDNRAFNEHALHERVRSDSTMQSCEVECDGTHTLMEHISVCMKRLCQALAPSRRRWWFVRFRKASLLPGEFREVRVALKRNTLGKFISAVVEVDGARLGTIDFIGVEQ